MDSLQVEDEEGPQDDLLKFNRGSFDCCAGKGIDIQIGDETIKITGRAHINEGISTSFCQGFVYGFF